MIRNAYLRKMAARLERMDEEIDRLLTTAEAASAETKSLYGRQREILLSKAEEARRRIEAVRSGGAASWGTLKKGVEDAFDDLRNAVDDAIRQIRKTGSNDR